MRSSSAFFLLVLWHGGVSYSAAFLAPPRHRANAGVRTSPFPTTGRSTLPPLPAAAGVFPFSFKLPTINTSDPLVAFFIQTLISYFVPTCFAVFTIAFVFELFDKSASERDSEDETKVAETAMGELYSDLYGTSKPSSSSSFSPSHRLFGNNNNNKTKRLPRNVGIPAAQYISMTSLNQKYDSYDFSVTAATTSKVAAAADYRSKSLDRALQLAVTTTTTNNDDSQQLNAKNDDFQPLSRRAKIQLAGAERDFLRVGRRLMAKLQSLEASLAANTIDESLKVLSKEQDEVFQRQEAIKKNFWDIAEAQMRDKEKDDTTTEAKEQGEEKDDTTTEAKEQDEEKNDTTTEAKEQDEEKDDTTTEAKEQDEEKNETTTEAKEQDEEKDETAVVSQRVERPTLHDQNSILKEVRNVAPKPLPTFKSEVMLKEVSDLQKALKRLELDFIGKVVMAVGVERAKGLRQALVGDISVRGSGAILLQMEKRPLSAMLSDESAEKKSLFVMRFPGDTTASQLNGLREEVTAIVRNAKPGDEALVVLQTGGGTVTGYGLAAGQLARLKKAGMHLTVAVEQVAASGGYMMTCVADKIVASPFAVLGSIGVISDIPNVYQRLKDEGIEFQTVTAGKYKRTLTPTKKVTAEDFKKTKEDVEDILVLFKDFVKQNRQQLDMEEIATGETWFGEAALEKGLCDEISTVDDVLLEYVDKGYNVYEVKYSPPPVVPGRLASFLASSPSAENPSVLRRAIRWLVQTFSSEIQAEMASSASLDKKYMAQDDSASRYQMRD